MPEFCPWSSSSWVCPAPARRPSAPCWRGASTGTSRMPTIFTAPPMSARCTVAFRSTTRIGCLGSGRSPTRSTDWRTDKQHGVVTCSALKRRYRNIMIGHRPDVRLVYLKGDRPSLPSVSSRDTDISCRQAYWKSVRGTRRAGVRGACDQHLGAKACGGARRRNRHRACRWANDDQSIINR